MKAGSKWRLHVPSELAYGAQGVGSIPPHSVLVFDVELLDVL
jgi:FKBP-type peptidyl-prolyl cis-trans isomerase FklB